MKWSLQELNKHRGHPLVFSETLDLKESLMNRDCLIQDIQTVSVAGQITAEKSDYLLHYTADVTITVPSSRSLNPVELPLSLTVTELFMTKEQFQQKSESLSDGEIIVLEKSTIDLNESVEDNILLAIPLQILTEEEKNSEEMPKGKDWTVISEADYLIKKKQQQKEIVDPRLAKLSQLTKKKIDEK